LWTMMTLERGAGESLEPFPFRWNRLSSWYLTHFRRWTGSTSP